ncbi:family 43 glycosylhydrolase [Actinoplanes sp. CA-142083]|uniref:glycoside hydrolase family 43 protein n=1 Tax=Actinoplanes sp. CA-142083 TaxID=3239903 RepID=UPI003D9103BD
MDRYRNPVLDADFSDPDVIRVGDDFYLVASSFGRVPGLPILHSHDLVSWRLIGHALDRLFDVPQPGCGVWAPALRHHDGLFWIFYPDPDRGIFVLTAESAAGPWSPPRLLKGGRGLIDPCPLWDDDGRAYLVHAWARSRAGFNNRLTLHEMSPSAGALLDDGRTVIDGDALPGYRTLEGPKLYKRDGWYWIWAPAGGVRDGWQSAFRSRSIAGPYDGRIVLARGESPINGPHQGAWVDTPGGEDWFLHFQDRHAYGRVVHLQPMAWDGDGWPVIGNRGTPVLTHRRPGVAGAPSRFPEVPEWFWAANPDPSWLTPAPGGGMRLACAPSDDGDLRRRPNVLGRRLPGSPVTVRTSLRLSSTSDACRAGLVVLGTAYAWIGVVRRAGRTYLTCRTAEPGGPEVDAAPPVELPADVPVDLGLHVAEGDRGRFLVDGVPGPPFTATAGVWVGATLGVFASGEAGYADFGYPEVIR